MMEFMSRSAVSKMQLFLDELVQQATDVGMTVNGRETKELLIGSDIKDPRLHLGLRLRRTLNETCSCQASHLRHIQRNITRRRQHVEKHATVRRKAEWQLL